MLKIDNIENNTIDLNGVKSFNDVFKVISTNEKGKFQQFHVSFISSDLISIERHGSDALSINIDVPHFLKNGFFILKNMMGDKIIIEVKPSQYFINDRNYKFKLTKTEEKEDGSLRIKILSKVNGNEMSWKCTYDGNPINYSVDPKKSEKSEFVKIKINDIVCNEFTSKLIFTQDESNEMITLDILNTKNGLKIK